MNSHETFIALVTLIRKEVRRFMRIWVQTLLPPAITMVLYFVIFGSLIGRRIGEMGGYDYIQFVVPGLIMMAVITNAYANVSSSFYSHKFQHCIEEILVSPMPAYIILLGFVGGGVVRGVLVGLVVSLLSLFFTQLHVQHLGITVLVIVSTALLFSLAGFINAIFANKFDDISIVPTFILTPLTYLGGVFYSMDMLPPFWRMLSLANPIVYMVNAFRYGILGVSDVNVYFSIAMIMVFMTLFFAYALWLLKKGVGIRS